MPAREPHEAHKLWEAAANSADFEAILDLYEKDSVFFSQPGQRADGIEQIRAALEAWRGLNPQVSMETKCVVQCGDIALTKSEWTVKATGPDGKPIEVAGNGTEVLRRQADGSWRFLIDDPYGVV